MAKRPVVYQATSSMDADGGKKSPGAPAKRFVTYTRTSEGPRKRNQKPAGGWLWSPGTFEPFVDGYKLLVSMSQPEHLVDGQLQRVAVGGYEGDKRVYLWSTHVNDPDGIEVKRYRGKPRINIAAFLAQIKVSMPVGVGERFDLVEADADSPAKPALMLNLDKPLERKNFETTKKKGASKRSPNAKTQSGGSQPAPEQTPGEGK